MEGVVRVDVVVAGIVVEACRAVTLDLSRVIVVDAVGAAMVRDIKVACRADRMMSLIVILVWQYCFRRIVTVASGVVEKVERNHNGKDSFHMEKSAGHGVLTSSETRHPK
jgi:hypothetical protein